MSDFINKYTGENGSTINLHDERIQEIGLGADNKYLRVDEGSIIFDDAEDVRIPEIGSAADGKFLRVEGSGIVFEDVVADDYRLPEIGSEDAGKFVKVGSDSFIYEEAGSTTDYRIGEIGSDDNGKLLKVDNGSIIFEELGSVKDYRLPDITSADEGKYLKVEDGAIIFIDDPNKEKEYPYKHELELILKTPDEAQLLFQEGSVILYQIMHDFQTEYGSMETWNYEVMGSYTQALKSVGSYMTPNLVGSGIVYLDLIGGSTGVTSIVDVGVFTLAHYSHMQNPSDYFKNYRGKIKLTIETDSSDPITLDNIKQVISYKKSKIIPTINFDDIKPILLYQDSSFDINSSLGDLRGSAALYSLRTMSNPLPLQITEMYHENNIILGSFIVDLSGIRLSEDISDFPLGSVMLYNELNRRIPLCIIDHINDTITNSIELEGSVGSNIFNLEEEASVEDNTLILE